MSIETFPSINPDYGASKQAQPRVVVSQFAGYSQRVQIGINNDPKEWSLNWTNINETQANQIEDFLEARAGVQAFNWSPPDDTETYKWTCATWTKTMPYSNLFNISATFVEQFEP
jgi:phage-related protein|tara:strand:+ start:410 stop:754 length:345 start_codon:yes stop_codon:yes gene_type:complete